MLTRTQYENAQKKAWGFFKKAGIVITEYEKKRIEIADFGLDQLEKLGIEVIVYVNTKRVCAKEIILFPGQTCPEHKHPTKNGVPGKEETFRCRWGKVYIYVPGEKTSNIRAVKYNGHEQYLTCMHEIVLNPGEQYTLSPDTLHWFQAGEDGAVVSEFSTTSTDEQDIFTDPRINRFTKIANE